MGHATIAAGDAGTDPIEVVVLGGGYVAVWGYRAMVRRLRRALRTGQVRITVVSASTTHAFHGWTGEVLAGLVRHDRTRTPLVDLVPRATLVHGAATGVDLDRRTVAVDTTDGVRHLHFDHLLIGVGTCDALAVPGLAEHGLQVKGGDALAATTTHLQDVVARAAATPDRDERRRLLTVVVAGGGFAGVEMAAAIAARLHNATRATPALTGARPRVVLVHSGPSLLADLRPRFDRLAEYATTRLEDVGVEIRLDTRLEAATATGAMLGGTQVDAATVLATVGQVMVPLGGTGTLTRARDGRLATDAWLRTSHDRVWSGGDVAAVPHVLRGRPCPPNALWAIKHGTRAGDNIGRTIRGRRLRRFRYVGLGQAASLGVGRGAVELYGVTLTGWPGWLARWGFFHAFMPSRRRALATIGDWLAIPHRGRPAVVDRLAVPPRRGDAPGLAA